jgi:hypothetical protein
MFGCAPMNSTYDYWKNGVPWEGPPGKFCFSRVLLVTLDPVSMVSCPLHFRPETRQTDVCVNRPVVFH